MAAFVIGIAAGLCCVWYGLRVRALGSGTGFHRVWFGLGALCLLAAGLLGSGLWCRLPLFFRAAVLIAMVLVLLAFLVVCLQIFRCFGSSGRPGLDYILVLGAQVREDGPSAVLRFRLERALRYLAENPDTLCIVSGGQGRNEPCSEAEGMAAYLMSRGLPENRILQEPRAVSTAENIAFSRALLPEGASLGIVTNDFHMFRALQLARSQGLRAVWGIGAPSTHFFLLNNLLREFFGEVRYLLRRLR